MMKKLLLLLIIGLLVSSAAVAKTYTPNAQDTTGDDSSSVGTPADGEQGYVVTTAFPGPDGNMVTPGTVYEPPYTDYEKAVIAQSKTQNTGAPFDKRTARLWGTYKNEYGSKRFRYVDGKFQTSTSKTSGFDADYRTDTIYTYDPATGVKTEKRVVSVCGKGLATCDEDDKQWEYLYAKEKTTTLNDDGVITSTSEEIWPDEDSVDGETYVTHDANGNPIIKRQQGDEPNPNDPPVTAVATMTKTYEVDGDTSTLETVSVVGSDGQLYYGYINGEVENNLDTAPLSGKQKDQLRKDIVNSGIGDFTDAWDTLTVWQSLGRLVSGYEEYKGITQLTSLIWPEWGEQAQANKQKIQQEFVLATGIQGTLDSLICGSIYDGKAHTGQNNVVTGRGPGGGLVTSAHLQAYQTPPIDFGGLNREQFTRLFGNSTVINGRTYDINAPDFNDKLAQLERFTMRLYRVQWSVTNNLDAGFYEGTDIPDLHYNLEFKGARTAKWFPNDQKVGPGKTATANKEKYSANAYNEVCLTFNPALPEGHAIASWGAPQTTDRLCAKIVTEAGPPTNLDTAPPADDDDNPTTEQPTQEGGTI